MEEIEKEEGFFRLNCSWKDCSFFEYSEEPFYEHVSNHIPQLRIIKNDDGVEMYECNWKDCHFNTTDSEQVVRHVKYHGYHSILKTRGLEIMKKKNLPSCMYSEDSFSIQAQQIDKIKCNWNCGEYMPGIKELIDHVAHIHVNETHENVYPCGWSKCKSTFSKRSKLLEHVKVHTGEKKLACPMCGSCFSNQTKFTDHCQRQQPIDENSSQCYYCHSYLPTEKLLRDHMRQHVHHYRCSICGMTCRTPGCLKRHMAYRHSSIKSYTCLLCNYRCKTNNDLRLHLLHHTGDKYEELSCNEPNCDFKSKQQSVLTRHVYKVHSENKNGGLYCCHLCDKSYTRGFSLTQHLCSVHDIRKPSEYSRFIYKSDSDGCNRLRTVRLESIEVAAESDKKNGQISEEEDDPDGFEDEIKVNDNIKSETITIDVVDESGQIILSDNVSSVMADNSLPPDAKIVAVGQ